MKLLTVMAIVLSILVVAFGIAGEFILMNRESSEDTFAGIAMIVASSAFFMSLLETLKWRNKQ